MIVGHCYIQYVYLFAGLKDNMKHATKKPKQKCDLTKDELMNEFLKLKNYRTRLEILKLEFELGLPRSEFTVHLPQPTFTVIQDGSNTASLVDNCNIIVGDSSVNAI